MAASNKKLKPLTDSKRYSDFVNARDRALEKILHWHLSALDILMEKTKRKVVALASSHPSMVDRELGMTAYQVHQIAVRLRQKAYTVSYFGEAQAIHNVFGQSKTKPVKQDLGPAPSGGSLDSRVMLAFNRLKRKIDDALELSKVLGETHEERKVRIEKAFPPTRPAPKTTTPALSQKRKRVREAFMGGSGQGSRRVSTGFFDEEEWQEILDDYTATELPPDIFQRGPDDRVVFFDADDTIAAERYSWELEQEATEDFVRQVRDGAIDAANDNGISDFIWNAVIDAKTDDCCDVRDGKTSSEIEAELENGPIDDQACDAIVAPAHFNCRCKSVPATDDIPEQAPPDFQGFDDWLAQKAEGG